jgi:hypothetical protein
LESVASLNEAALDAANGDVGDALHLYQHALRLDDSIGDQAASAQDWLAYGQFLDRSGFPARLVYACYVKSASLDDSHLDQSQKDFLTDATKRAAKQNGALSVTIRQNPEPILNEALALTR